MRIAVIGAGGVGGYVGGQLARAGEDVAFIARGDTLAALRGRGLRVLSAEPERAFEIPRVAVTDDPASIGVVDVVLHTTKTPGFAAALEAALPLLGPDTLLLTTQNGVGTPDVAAGVVGGERVVPVVVQVFSRVAAPGVIEHRGGPGSLTFGSTLTGSTPPGLDAFRAACTAAGIPVELAPDARAALWLKAMFIGPFGALGALTGQPLGVLRDPVELRDTLASAISEVVAVGRAHGVRLPEDAVGRTLAACDAQPAASTSSMQRDLLAGVASELDAQVGEIVRLGDAAGVPTPLHDLLLRALDPERRA